MKTVPNPAASKGASRTRDSMRQPIVGDDADWSQRTNLTSIQGTSGRVMPAASQMNKAAGFNPKQVAAIAQRVQTGARKAAPRFAGMDPAKARSARLEAFQQTMGTKLRSANPTMSGVKSSIDAGRFQQAAAPAANKALVGASGVPNRQVQATVAATPRYAHSTLVPPRQAPAGSTTVKANAIRKNFPQAVPQAPAVASGRRAVGAPMLDTPAHIPTVKQPSFTSYRPGIGGTSTATAADVSAHRAAERASKLNPLPPVQQTMGKNAMIDTSGPEPKLVFEKLASENTALGGKYPLDSYADIRAAVDFFQQSWTEFDPVERHIYCVKTAAAAQAIGLDIPPMMARYGSLEYAPDLDAHIASRKANLEKNAHGMYDALMEKRAAMHPEEFADLLMQADVATGLNWHWGGPVADPYLATFGGKPQERMLKVANSEISERQLQSIVESGALEGVFEKDLVAGFRKDPAAIFQSLPDDAKQIIANLIVG